MTEFTKKELKRKFTNIQEAFKSFNKIELKGRKHIQYQFFSYVNINDIFFQGI